MQVVVTNAAGSSDPVMTSLQPIYPAFFASQNYVAAVRSDGTVITGAAPAVKPGDAVSLYGTGFGPTDPAVAPGALVQTQAALANRVTVTVGGVEAEVSFAGLSAAGLYQFNIIVPTVAGGDQEVLAHIAGLKTQPGILLKIQT